ncbi:retinol dehydrogenase 7-like [Spea bombifrons]|uniref:retinol dehydrogenase 7-like n=1 Tax=Spea bombifrons TaxID=233779 RepID=UPI00234A98B5|nr:retinol dehydrogenase 7-like [Spea bombifrons]
MWLTLLMAVLALIYWCRWHRQSQTLENIPGKYVLITGCDSGFGNLLAKQLDQRGMRVLAACLTEKAAANLKKATSSRLQTVILDVTDSQSVSAAAKWVSSRVGDEGLWGLVNNAGFGYAFGPNEWQRREDFAKVLNVNFLGLVDVTLNVLPLVRKAQGRIVNVSSCGGRLPAVGGGYCPSKYGVEAFSDSLRREMQDFGVKVSIIEPGVFKTPMNNTEPHINNLKRLWENAPAEIKEAYGEQFYQQTYRTSFSSNNLNSKLSEVTYCMEHALTAVYPWTRYSPGWDCKLYYLPLSYLPTPITDYVLSRSAPKPAQGEKQT